MWFVVFLVWWLMFGFRVGVGMVASVCRVLWVSLGMRALCLLVGMGLALRLYFAGLGFVVALGGVGVLIAVVGLVFVVALRVFVGLGICCDFRFCGLV